MRYPWANIALFILLLIQLLTGYFGFVNGRSTHAWILWAHGAGAYALLLLLYWKGEIILDVVRRGRRWSARRIGFYLLVGLLLATLLTGLLWTFDGPLYLGGFSLVTLHIFLAIPLIILLLWHSWHMRWIVRRPTARDRRAFLRTATVALGGWITWLGLRWGKQRLGLPAARRRFTGSYEIGSFTGLFPRVSWIADRPPPVDVADWHLHLDGAVAHPLRLSYEALQQLPQIELAATLDCTGGWYSTQQWQGVPVGELLDAAGVLNEARSITFRAVSGYQRRFALEDAANYLLALRVAGAPLSHGHGFPVRLVAPDQRGVNWVKWIDSIWVNTTPAFWQLPLPVQ